MRRLNGSIRIQFPIFSLFGFIFIGQKCVLSVTQVGIFDFLQKNAKNTPPTIWQWTWQFLEAWGKQPPAHKYTRVYSRLSIGVSPVGGDRWEGEKINKGCKSVPYANFHKVEEHKHNFVSLTVLYVSELCQTVRDQLFLLGISF
jgi:hypothetical protein